MTLNCNKSDYYCTIAIQITNKSIMNNQNSHWRNLTNEPYLGAWDLEKDGKFTQVTLTIERIFKSEMTGQMGKQEKPFIKFKEFAKPMICNKTNFKRLENRFRTFDYNQYIGQQIILLVENVSAPEGKVNALRISSKPPQQKAVKKAITDMRFDAAIEKIKSNEYTKEQLLETATLTEDQQSKLDMI